MKKLLIVFLIMPFLAMSQTETNNFKIDGAKLIWQKVYEIDATVDQLLSYFGAKGVLKDVIKTENGFTARIENVTSNYKGLGMSEMSVPMYVSRMNVSGGVNVEVKEGRYRVTITNLLLTQNYSDGLSEAGEKTAIEFFSGSDKLKKSFQKKPSEIYNYTFDTLFKYQVSDDNW